MPQSHVHLPTDPAVPDAVRNALLPGGERKSDLQRAALAAAGAGRDGLCAALLFAAFDAAPLEGPAAALALGRGAGDAFPEARPLLEAVSAAFVPPEEDRYAARLKERGQGDALRRCLLGRMEKAPDNLYWKAEYLAACRRDPEAMERLELPEEGPFRPVALRLRGDAANLGGEPERAAKLYERSLEALFLPWTATRLAGLLLEAGERRRAADFLRAALRARPWHAGTLLRLYDAVHGLDERRGRLEGGAAVLLYTWNKAEDIDRTLSFLAESFLFPDAPGGKTAVVVLDNGSTDATADVLAGYADRFGADRFRTVSLPVNVGAPAARNLLMRTPEARRADWIVYLDDDVAPPKDWLARLAAAAEAFPEAGVWGCRVVDAYAPAVVQSSDLFLTEPTEHAAGPDNPFGRKFDLTRPEIGDLDPGACAYLRPCASVTGCCHLFRRERLLDCGDFDIRFSPSQYDDVDHDIRLLLSGTTPVYQGHLRIPHFKRTGREGRPGGAAFDLGFANQFKLHGKYDAGEMRRAVETARKAALDDLRAKREALAAMEASGP